MSKIWLTEQETWALAVLEVDNFSDVVSLVSRMGYDPENFFIGQRCEGLDFRGSQVANISFANADLTGAKFFSDQLATVLDTGPAHHDRVIVFPRDETFELKDETAPNNSSELALSGKTVEQLAYWATAKDKYVNFRWISKTEALTAYSHFFSSNRNFITNLILRRTDVADLTPIAGLDKLAQLNLSGTQVVDLTPIAGLDKLAQLNLSGTQVADLTPLVGLNELVKLSFKNSQVADLTPIAGLTKLNHLNLGGTHVVDLSPIARLTKLNQLILDRTRVADLTPIAGLTKLNHLNLIGTRVADLTPLRMLGSLESLYLSGTAQHWNLEPVDQQRTKVFYVKSDEPINDDILEIDD